MQKILFASILVEAALGYQGFIAGPKDGLVVQIMNQYRQYTRLSHCNMYNGNNNDE